MTVERRLEELANRSHGVITRSEALRAGVSRQAFEQRVRSGILLRAHRGVYRLGHRAPSSDATYMAAVRAVGDKAGLSGQAAAHLLSLLSTPPAEISVTTPRNRRVEDIEVRRARNTRLLLTHVRGIPVTTPAWTLLDVAPELDDATLKTVCHEAHWRYRLKPEAVARLARRRGHVKGARRLLAILGGDDPMLLSRLEEAYVGLLNQGNLELPETNRRLAEGYVDCRWPHLKLIVELDSYRFHNSRHAWERDRDRDRAARRRGEELIRYTPEDVFDNGDEVLGEMRARVPRSR